MLYDDNSLREKTAQSKCFNLVSFKIIDKVYARLNYYYIDQLIFIKFRPTKRETWAPLKDRLAMRA
jgi:hypothetical protein